MVRFYVGVRIGLGGRKRAVAEGSASGNQTPMAVKELCLVVVEICIGARRENTFFCKIDV